MNRRPLTYPEVIATLRAAPERGDILFDASVQAGVLTGFYRHPGHPHRLMRIVLQAGKEFIAAGRRHRDGSDDWTPDAEVKRGCLVPAIREGAEWLETGVWPRGIRRLGETPPQNAQESPQGDSDGCAGKSTTVDSDGPQRAGEGLC